MERRAFLVGGGMFAGLAGAATMLPASSKAKVGGPAANLLNQIIGSQSGSSLSRQTLPLEAQSNDLTPYTGAWTDVQLNHLLRRSMLGVPFSQYTTAKAMGTMSSVVNKLLDNTLPLPAKFASYLDEYLTVDSKITDPNLRYIDSNNKQRLEVMRTQQVVNWWFDLMVKENLSIREKMTLMWSNHFVTGTDANRHAGHAYTYNQMLRANSLGNLKTFAYAMATDPMMLVYLNGNQNFYGKDPMTGRGSGSHINENFARELMELFTLGLIDPKTGKPNYTEADVQSGASALTGWAPTVVAPFTGVFYPTSHDATPVQYLGSTLSNPSLQSVLDTIFGLGQGYNVAWFICQKIYWNFVYYDSSSASSQGVIDAMAKLLLQSNWELVPVMKALLKSDHFYDANVIGSQLKSPTNWAAGIVREFQLTYPAFSNADATVSGVDGKGINTYTDPNLTLSYITNSIMGTELGQMLQNPPNVKGWPGGENWISTGTFPLRETVSLGVLANTFDGSAKVRGIKITFAPLTWINSIPGAANMTSVQLAAAAEALTIALQLGPKETATLYGALNFLKLPETDFYLKDIYVQQFAELIAQLPEFQLL
jgi:uncharacterized protein (DUF1800 family)